MIHWFLPRRAGKTTKLISYAVAHGCDLLVASSMIAECVIDTALYMGVTGPVNRNRRRGPYSVGDMQILTPDDLYYPGRIEGRRRHERPLLIDEMDLVIEKLCRREVVGYSATHPDPEWGDAFSFPTRGQDGEP